MIASLLSLDLKSLFLSFSINEVLVAVIVIYGALAWIRRYSFWWRQGIRGPIPLPIIGSLMEYSLELPHVVDARCLKKYGRIIGYFKGQKPSIMIADPYLLRKIMVSDFPAFSNRHSNYHPILRHFLIYQNGRDWKNMRSILSPTFTSSKMKNMLPLMEESVSALKVKLNQTIRKKRDVDIKKVYGLLTLDIIGKTGFAINTNVLDRGEEDDFVKNVWKLLSFPYWKFYCRMFLPAPVMSFFKFSHFDDGATVYLSQVARTIYQERIQGRGKRLDYPDLMQLMIEAKNEDNSENPLTKKHLTEDEIIANTILLLVAGYDAIASTLSIASYNLALHPDAQEKLREEVNAALEADGGKLSYETLNSLKYMDAVINETLRLYPPVTFADRYATQDSVLEMEEGGKIFIPKGGCVHIPLYSIHRDPQFFPNPDCFKPERFLPDSKDEIVPYTFIPFILGPRNCIGMRFALLEIKLALAYMLRNFRFIRSEKTAIPLDFSTSTNFLRATDVTVAIEAL